MTRRAPRCLLACALLGAPLLVAPAAPLAADWLVTRGGERVETRGPWRVEGKLVIFTAAAGELASLRLAEVDLEASAAATAAALAPAPTPVPAPPRAAVLVLTDADVGHSTPAPAGVEAATADAPPEAGTADDAPEAGTADDAPAPAGSAADSAPAGADSGDRMAGGGDGGGPLSVVDWRELETGRGGVLRIEGTLRNPGTEALASVGLEVILEDGDGGTVDSTAATLERQSLAPGQTTFFRASFADVRSYATVRFATHGLPLTTAAAAPER